jgi:hypothetical protein
MVKKFNLLELHDNKIDKKPFSWICFDINDNTKLTVEALLSSTMKKFQYKRDLINSLKDNLSCSYDTVERYISFRKNWFAIPIFLELLKLNEKERKRLSGEINSGINYLKTSGPTSKKIKALRELTLPLCEIAGAHAADGTLPLRFNLIFINTPAKEVKYLIKDKCGKESATYYDSSINRYYLTICSDENSAASILSIAKRDNSFERLKINYFFRITDAHKDSLEYIKKNIFLDFSSCYSLRRFEGVNAWTLTVAKKIIIRYLIKFIAFTHGSKTYSVRIPQVIREAPLSYQDAFVRAFLQFDGSVELDGNIKLQAKSQKLILDFVDYFKMRGIKCNLATGKDSRGCYTIKVRKMRNKDLRFLLFSNTLKHQLLTREFLYQPASVKDAIHRLNMVSNSMISIKLGNFMKLFYGEEKTLYDIQRELPNSLQISTLQKYAAFLMDCNILRRSRMGKAYKYGRNNNLKSWRVPLKC